jgi:hypothetical protein
MYPRFIFCVHTVEHRLHSLRITTTMRLYSDVCIEPTYVEIISLHPVVVQYENKLSFTVNIQQLYL